MKRYQLWGGAFFLMTVATAYAGTPIAPVYPGAVPDTVAGDVTARVYLSRAPMKKVLSWYGAKIGAMSRAAAGRLAEPQQIGEPLGTTDPKVDADRMGRVLMDQSEVVRSLKDMTLTKDIGVLCEGMHIKPSTTVAGAGTTQTADGDAAAAQQMARMQQQLLQEMQIKTPRDREIARMGELFEVMRTEALGGRYGHTKRQLLAVYAKYKHLETAWYPSVKSGNGVVSYDRWLLARERQQVAQDSGGGSGNMQALAARIQAAAAAGRMDQVAALSRQAQQGGATPAMSTMFHDQWDHWLAILKKLDAHAYRTRIVINTQPKSWGY